ncbi:exonuclease SbcCD subunit D [Bifidobacterium tissieri]|uniref:Nuclease SbcCD subunit D n=1 Tax=Bifidobacterium tissieri TaxID=1630162 RepID=A0A5M9ZTZ2_9BIFI|nr:exonuclease SbcCD subunit D C-terminal domain-containing protein [Bifidobacterium tissieri]KAA8827580.1 exonuclease subunit SbcD [Bifidobacterium tissieri]KAA8830978.1 exonuclease subunit SbcD [Bifidobacterium tissieri]
MRILHTSDWHIGRRFKGVDLVEYQRRALDWLIDTVQREHVDVVCVSGDVYDSPMPSAASVDLLDDALTRLTSIIGDEGRPAVDVIVTPGNHDSARKLGFGARMMRPNLHLRCEIAQIADPVIVTRGGTDGREDRLAVYALPYLDPDVARPVLEKLLEQNAEDFVQLDSRAVSQEDTRPEEEVEHVGREDGDNPRNSGDTPETTEDVTPRLRIPRSHEGVMTSAMRLIRMDLNRRRQQAEAEGASFHAVLMAHAFVSGAAPSDSERNITIGGVDSVPAAVFSNSGLDYLALGHLHRAQQVRIPSGGAVVPDGLDDDRDSTNTENEKTSIAAHVTNPNASKSGDPADLVPIEPHKSIGSVTAPQRSKTSMFKSGNSAPPLARYSGSLLAYSFSEACTPPVVGNGKSVVIVDMPEPSDTPVRPSLRTIPVESAQPALVRLAGSPEELLGDLAESHRHDWVSLTVVSDTYPHGMYQKLDAAYEHALEKNFKITQRSAGTADSANGSGPDRAMANLHETRSELDVLTGFVRYTLGREPNDGEIAVLRDAVERVHATDDEKADTTTSTAATTLGAPAPVATDTATVETAAPTNRKGARA